jgi:hypothetical protein
MVTREESHEPEQPKHWWRRIPWIAIGTATTVVIGIASLAFTGVATYYDAEVSKDQLDQSREDAKRETRSQAMRVTYWADTASKNSSVHVMNRSPDPVSRVSLAFTAQLNAKQNVLFPIWLGDLPPCSELVIHSESMFHQRNTPWDRKTWYRPVVQNINNPDLPSPRKLPTDIWGISVRMVSYEDRDGEAWKREYGALSLDNPSAIGSLVSEAEPSDWIGIATQVQKKSAPLCEDPTR